jgi:16S rRNA C967 or C1407 C5-methylase (RsmB/RsmF family)
MRSPRDRLKQNVLQQFDRLWHSLFTSHVHLDTALHQQPAAFRAPLAQLIMPILSRPATLAEWLRLPVQGRNARPFALSPSDLPEWQFARDMADALYDRLEEDPDAFRKVTGWLPADYPDRILDEVDALSESLNARVGGTAQREALAVLTEPAPLSLRVSRKHDPSKVITQLTEELKQIGQSRLKLRQEEFEGTRAGRTLHYQRWFDVHKNERFRRRAEMPDEQSEEEAIALRAEEYQREQDAMTRDSRSSKSQRSGNNFGRFASEARSRTPSPPPRSNRREFSSYSDSAVSARDREFKPFRRSRNADLDSDAASASDQSDNPNHQRRLARNVEELSRAFPSGAVDFGVPVLSKLSPSTILLDRHAPISQTQSFTTGMIDMQDEASTIMAYFALHPERFAPLLSEQPGIQTPAQRFVKKLETTLASRGTQSMSPATPKSVTDYIGKWLPPSVSPIKLPSMATSCSDKPLTDSDYLAFANRAPALPSSPHALTIIDACAGGGGKTVAMADALQGRGRVFAYDVIERKLTNMKQRAERLGLTNIHRTLLPDPVISASDPSKVDSNVTALLTRGGQLPESIQKFRGRADVGVVDVPCSGWGDLKWRLAQKESSINLQNLPSLQHYLLQSYAPLVKPGGRLVFGVCTLRRAETIGVLERFFDSNPEFEPWGGGFLGPISSSADAFFMCAAHKRDKSAMNLMRSDKHFKAEVSSQAKNSNVVL